ncbi:MAG: hypothetical protein Kow0069_39110 [Promethearchaeota archaeon]
MTVDIVKFFQAFVRQMVSVGGVNLPRTISTSLGAKLGQTYREKGVTDWKQALTSMIQGMGGSVEFVEEGEGAGGARVVNAKYFSDFCPIGGAPSRNKTSERASLVVESICRPYVTGFLKGYFGDEKLAISFPRCIVKDGGNSCQLCLEVD